jgi:hypothetical protein
MSESVLPGLTPAYAKMIDRINEHTLYREERTSGRDLLRGGSAVLFVHVLCCTALRWGQSDLSCRNLTYDHDFKIVE